MFYFSKIHLLLFFNILFVFAEQESHLKTVIHKALAAKARQCMRNVNATESDLEYLRNEPPFPEKSSCIITCLLEKINIVQDKKFSKKGFIMIISPLVLTNTKKLDHMKSVAENCENEIPEATLQFICLVLNEVRNIYSIARLLTKNQHTVWSSLRHVRDCSMLSACRDPSKINHHEVSKCQLGNEITTCVYKYAPELHFKS